MATNPLSSVLDALTTRKGAVIAGVAMLGFAVLFNIVRSTTPTGAETASTAAATASAPFRVAEAGAAAKGGFTQPQVDAIQDIVRQYLLKNPELMIEVTKELEKRQLARQEAEHLQLIGANKSKIFSSAKDFVAGDPKGDVTVVEFFDYNCGWCKRALNEVIKLTKADPKVRVVMKEFPIFGDGSMLAAKAAMASRSQGKYWEFHTAMMREKQVGPQNVFVIAERVGLDVAQLKKDMADPAIENALKETHEIAQHLNIEGTPGFIVDGKVNVGFLPMEGLQRLVADTRKTGCKMC
ncbi:MAG: DsbA family protein [Hyphomicrobiaceae bacterium]